MLVICITNKRMKTRSQTLKEKQDLYVVNIDFDGARKAWNKNKKSIGNGHYKYICLKENENGICCGKICYKELSYCWQHRNEIFRDIYKIL